MLTSERAPLVGGPLKHAQRERLTGMVLIFLVVLLGDGNRGLVLPTLAGYIHKFGGGAKKLALANAGFSFGRLLVAPWLGLWMDRRPTAEVVLFTLVVSLLCNMCYTYADGLGARFGPQVGLWAIILSRSVLGVGACVLGLGRGFISKHTTRARRTAFISLLCAAQFFGFTAFSGFSLLQNQALLQSLGLDHNTFPGALLCLFYATLLAAVLLLPSNLWDPPEVFESSPTVPPSSGPQYGTPAAPPPVKEHAFNLTLALTFVGLNFTVRAILATQETLGTCVVHYLYSGENVCHHKVIKIAEESVKAALGAAGVHTPQQTLFFVAAFFTTVGLLGMVNFLILYFVAPRTEDRVLLLSGVIATAVGLAFMLDPSDGAGPPYEMSLTRFAVGFFIAWAVGYPLTQTVVVSGLSKVLAPSQVGRWMGYQASAGSAGRVVGPLLAGYAYQAFAENDGLVPFSVCFLCAVFCSAFVAMYWDRLRPL